MARTDYPEGALVRYTGGDVFDRLIRTDDIGVVIKVEDGWVHAKWERGGIHSVPVRSVKPAPKGATAPEWTTR